MFNRGITASVEQIAFERLYINYQLDALIITLFIKYYSPLHVRASSAHLQEDIVVYKQHMLPSLSIRFPGGLSIRS